jgi:hypothetical protein
MGKRLVMIEAESSDRGEALPYLVQSYSRLGMWREAHEWQVRVDRERPKSEWPAPSRFELLRLQARGAELRTALREAFDSMDGKATSSPPPEYGILQALSGDYQGAVRTLESQVSVNAPLSGAELEANSRQALAWAYLNTGATDRAQAILSELDRQFRDRQTKGWLHLSIDLAMFAQNAVLAGDDASAIDRLRAAVSAGWRDYYSIENDPRWGSLLDDVRFRQVMDGVKADIDSQRATLERIEASDDFAARVDQALRNGMARTDSRP